jgi:HK97 family phage portal protein
VPWLHGGGEVTSKALPNVLPIDPYGISRPNISGLVYPDQAYEGFAKSSYAANELVYACIAEKCKTLPQATLRVYQEGQAAPLEQHPLRRLLAEPNDVTTEVELLQLLIVHLDLAGTAFLLINRSLAGVPVELWPVRPDLVRVIPAPEGQSPRNWRWGYLPNPGSTDLLPVDRRDMIRIRYPNPLDSYFGQAPMRPAARSVSLDNARAVYVEELLRNDAVPRVAITTQAEIDERVVSILQARWKRKFGAGNRGTPAFLQAGMDVKTLGLNLEDLTFGDLSAVEEARICMSFGVQPILVGAKVGLDRSTFANFAEAKASFWETTLMDLERLIVTSVRSKLLPSFLGVGRARVGLQWDNSEVLALQEPETARWERAVNALARGGITRNDFRRTVGLDPVPGGDVFLNPAGVTLQPATEAGAAEPAEPDEPAGGGGARQLEAAAHEYADHVLAELRGRRNGHGTYRPSTVVAP